MENRRFHILFCFDNTGCSIGHYLKAYWVSFLVSTVGITAGVIHMKANKYSYILYIIQISLYAYVSWRNRFIGEAVLAAFYLLPLYIYSAIKWIKLGNKEKAMPRYLR